MIGNTVKFWMDDRNVWVTEFDKEANIIYGLQRLQNHYSVSVDSIFVFHYFGSSTF